MPTYVAMVVSSLRARSPQISYAYQGIYILGCTLTNAYALARGLWPVYVPCLFEEVLIVSLTVMKVTYDRRPARMARREEERRRTTASSDGRTPADVETGTASSPRAPGP